MPHAIRKSLPAAAAGLIVLFCAAGAQAQFDASALKSNLNTFLKSNPAISQRLGAPATATAAENAAAALSNTDATTALRQALTVGAQRVAQTLGKPGGFSDPRVHIPLPGGLQKASAALNAMGMGGMTQDLENRINAAAEAATPKAANLLAAAVSKMSVTDAKSILTGPNDAATQYLQKAVGSDLAREMQPIVAQTLAQAGAVKSYDQVVGKYSQLPLVSGVKDDLNGYVTDKAVAGIFSALGREETAIRTNPAAQTTALLKKAFAAN
jgi:hypothetical protein